MTPTRPPDPAGENRSLSGGDRAAVPGRTGASAVHPPRAALARTPSPVTRAVPGRAAALGRGGAQSSDESAPDTSALSSGQRAIAGREAYDLARRKALRQGRRPADPQQAPGRPGAPARVAEMMRPCATVLPGGGVCGATGYEHDTGTRAGAEVRTRCSIATAAGPCGCRAYAPQPETQGGAT
jgi:hypothetical protein